MRKRRVRRKIRRYRLDSMSSSNVGTVQKQLKRTSRIAGTIFPKSRVSILGTLSAVGKRRIRKRQRIARATIAEKKFARAAIRSQKKIDLLARRRRQKLLKKERAKIKKKLAVGFRAWYQPSDRS